MIENRLSLKQLIISIIKDDSIWPPNISLSSTEIIINSMKIELKDYGEGNTLPRIDRYNDLYVITLTFSSSIDHLIDTLSNVFPLSYESDINFLNLIQCKKCQCQISIGSFLKSFTMPCEGWIDLYDLWICHPLPDNHPMAKTPYGVSPDPIKAQESVVFIGQDHLLCHLKDLDVGLRDFMVTCKNCDCALGTYFPDDGDDYEVRLFKYHIQSENPECPFRNYTFENTVCERMIHLAKTANMYRFRLCDIGMKKIIYLTLFDWNIRVYNSDSSLETVAKVLFHGEDSEKTNSAEVHSYYDLQYSLKDIKSLWNILIRSFKKQPIFHKYVLGSKISYLRRLSLTKE